MPLEILPLRSLKMLPDIQIRQQTRSDMIDYYASLIAEGSQPPPPRVVRTDGGDILADGWHRKGALEKSGIAEYTCEVTPGTMYDALVLACQMNSRIGLTLTRADRRRAVELLLATPEGYQLTNRQIAKLTGTTHPTVGSIREELFGVRDANGSTRPDPEDVFNGPIVPELDLQPMGYAQPVGDFDDSPVQTRSPQGSGSGSRSGSSSSSRPDTSGTYDAPQGGAIAGRRVEGLMVTWALSDGTSGSADMDHLGQAPAEVLAAIQRRLGGGRH